MNKQILKSNLLLLLTAGIWGFAFVAQRLGIKYIGAFTFNGVRFGLGSISLIPLLLFYKNHRQSEKIGSEFKNSLIPGMLCGIVLFSASSLQQIGLIGTSAGKAAFITGLYIVFVPILGIFLKQYIGMNSWIGALIALVGLYFLCVTDSFSISFSDLLELASAFFFAVHILIIDRFSSRVDALKLAFFQFVACSVLSMIVAAIFESISLKSLSQAIVPILYGGILSVGIAYTLQIVGQKNAQPSHAAIIFSMEAVFATIGGVLILNEQLSLKGISGCALMLAGMLLTQMKLLQGDREKGETKT